MADNDQTRVQEVEANIEAVENTYGEENFGRVISACIKDISVSLAMLVDAGSSSDNTSSDNT